MSQIDYFANYQKIADRWIADSGVDPQIPPSWLIGRLTPGLCEIPPKIAVRLQRKPGEGFYRTRSEAFEDLRQALICHQIDGQPLPAIFARGSIGTGGIVMPEDIADEVRPEVGGIRKDAIPAELRLSPDAHYPKPSLWAYVLIAGSIFMVGAAFGALVAALVILR